MIDLSAGDLLLSSPLLLDTNFYKTVLLITEHGEDGSCGLVLNRPTSLNLLTALESQCPPSLFEEVVYRGGPVRTENLFSLHMETAPSRWPAAQKIRHNIWFGAEAEIIRNARKATNLEQLTVRFFEGYSGWSSDQLEHEFEIGSWIIKKNWPNNLLAIDSNELYDQLIGSNTPNLHTPATDNHNIYN